MRILVVDDDYAIRRIFSHWLKRFGDVDTAMNGEEAIKSVKDALDEGAPYDLVCLDIVMPKLSGMQALKRMRHEEESSGLLPGKGAKVIMTTGVSESKNILEAFNEQCEAYLVKPIEQEDLYAAMRKIGFETA